MAVLQPLLHATVVGILPRQQFLNDLSAAEGMIAREEIRRGGARRLPGWRRGPRRLGDSCPVYCDDFTVL
jgi:hypothetical protein